MQVADVRYTPSTSMQVNLSPAAVSCIADLIKSRAGGNPSEVLERLLLSVLPEFRAQHTTVNNLTIENEKLRAALSTAAAVATSSSTSASSDADEVFEGGNASPITARKHYFKSIYDLDPSGS